MLRASLILVALCLVFAAGGAGATELYGYAHAGSSDPYYNANIYSIDRQTNSISDLGAFSGVGYNGRLKGITGSPNGQLYGYAYTGTSIYDYYNHVYSIDLESNSISDLGAFSGGDNGHQSRGLDGIAFSPNGQLYGYAYTGTSIYDYYNHVYSIDLESNSISDLGAFSGGDNGHQSRGLDGIAFSPNGQLYGYAYTGTSIYDYYNHVYSIDLESNSISDLGAFSGGDNGHQSRGLDGIAFSPERTTLWLCLHRNFYL